MRGVAGRRAYDRDRGYARWLGAEVLEAAPRRSVVRMTVRGDMTNGLGTCHSGVTYGLADTAFARMRSPMRPTGPREARISGTPELGGRRLLRSPAPLVRSCRHAFVPRPTPAASRATLQLAVEHVLDLIAVFSSASSADVRLSRAFSCSRSQGRLRSDTVAVAHFACAARGPALGERRGQHGAEWPRRAPGQPRDVARDQVVVARRERGLHRGHRVDHERGKPRLRQPAPQLVFGEHREPERTAGRRRNQGGAFGARSATSGP